MLENFVMNDKCAAGTGRFLDVIAKVLEVNLEDLEKLDEKSTVDVAISSTCTVFAESEVISQLAKGTKIEDIPVKVFKDNLNIYVNQNVLNQLGIELPESIKNDKSLSMIK